MFRYFLGETLIWKNDINKIYPESLKDKEVHLQTE